MTADQRAEILERINELNAYADRNGERLDQFEREVEQLPQEWGTS